MNAILEAPTMTIDVETEEEFSPDSLFPNAGGGGPPATILEEGDIFPARSGTATRAIPASGGAFFPQSSDPEPSALSPDTDAAPTYPWPSLQSPNPQSPGEALAKEFDALYHKYERRVYRQCFRMLGNPDDAEDLTQEVFLQLFRKIHTFRGEANFGTWLHRLTLNTVLMQLRRYRRWRDAVTSLDGAPGAADGVSDHLTAVSTLPVPPTTALDKLGLELAIAQLPSGYKEIFLLHDAQGFRHDEIAKLLGISEGTSKSQLHKARLRLRTLIGSTGERAAA